MYRNKNLLNKNSLVSSFVGTINNLYNIGANASTYKDTAIAVVNEIFVFSMGSLLIYGLGKLSNSTDVSVGVAIGICASVHASTVILKNSISQENKEIADTNIGENINELKEKIVNVTNQQETDKNALQISEQQQINHIQNQYNFDLILEKLKVMENNHLNTSVLSHVNLASMKVGSNTYYEKAVWSKENITSDFYKYLQKSKISKEEFDFDEIRNTSFKIKSNDTLVYFKDEIYVKVKVRNKDHDEMMQEELMKRWKKLKDESDEIDDGDTAEEYMTILNENYQKLYHDLFFLLTGTIEDNENKEDKENTFKAILYKTINDHTKIEDYDYKELNIPMSLFIYLTFTHGKQFSDYKFEPMSDDNIQKFFGENNDLEFYDETSVMDLNEI